MSHLEDTLALQLDAAGIHYEREFKFSPERRWRADFLLGDICLLGDAFLIEVEGDIWRKSGHTTGAGIQRDIDKANHAQLLGYRHFRVTADMIETGLALELIEKALGRPREATAAPRATKTRKVDYRVR